MVHFKPALSVQLLLATVITNCTPGESQSNFLDYLGPRDITRYENESNVYIPCPFSGSANPVWRINGVEYEAFNLPNNILPASYGLLITTVDLGMDGKSFQCISRSGQLQELSSVGILKVNKLPKEYASFYHEHGVKIEFSSSLTFSLNHQKTIFEEDFKTFSWNADTTCNMYRVTSVNCDNDEQHIWDHHIIQGTTLAIPSSFTVDSKNHSLYFTLESVHSDGTKCHDINFDFAVQDSDVTQDQSTSYNGSCVDVQSVTGSPAIMLPTRSGGNDCPCSITIRNTTDTYNLTRCSCAGDTIFIKSFSASTLKQETNLFKMCFSNLTRDMNNTVIHVYDLYRYCINDDGEQVIKAYRKYLRSFKLLIELPCQPRVTVNTTTGEVLVSVDEAEGIKVSHYKVIVRDVTNLTVDQKTIPHDMNNVSFDDLFQQQMCSPYNVTVSAYSTVGKSNSITTMVKSGSKGSDCDCIAENVVVDLNLIEGDSDSDVTVVGVQVNCTNYYEENVMIDIHVKPHGFPINTSIPVLCQKAVMVHYIQALKCGEHYDVVAYWTHSDSNTRCKLDAENSEKTVPCPEKGTDNTILISVGSVLGGLLIIALLIIVLLFVLYIKNKNGTQEYQPRT